MVDGTVAAWLLSMGRDTAMGLCLEAEVPVGPVNAVDEIFADPQFAARKMILRLTEAAVGEVAVPGVVPKLSRTPGRVASLGPALGEGNADVYDALGLSPERIGSLRERGVI